MKARFAAALLALLTIFCGLNVAEAQTPTGLQLGIKRGTTTSQPCVFARSGTVCDPLGTIDNSTGAFIAAGSAEISVTDPRFGVVMDNTGTSGSPIAYTTQFQAALDYLASVGGGKLKVPRGSLVLCQVNIPANVWIEGDGSWTNIFACNATTSIFVASGTTVINFVRISSLNINPSSRTATPQTGGSYVFFNNCNTCHVDHVTFNYFYTGITETGTTASGGAGYTVYSVLDTLSFIGGKFIGIDCGACSDAYIDHVQMVGTNGANATAGIRVQDTGGIWINNSDIVAMGIGTWLAPVAGHEVKWLFISNSALGDSGYPGGVGFFINPIGAGARVGNIVADNIWASSSQNGGTVIACGSGGTVDNIELHGVRAVANGSEGIHIQCGTNVKVLGGIMSNNSSALIGGSAGVKSAITVDANVSDFTIRDITCTNEPGQPNSQKYCVEVAAGSSNRYLIDNITGATATTTGTAISDGGTGTSKTVQGSVNNNIAQLPSLGLSTCASGNNALQFTPGTGLSCGMITTSGTGTVTSFSAGALSPLLTTSVANPTTTPALSFALNSQTANTGFMGPTSGGAAAPTFRALVGADLPAPSATTLGGVQSAAPVANNFVTSISTLGVPALAQPIFANLGGSLAITQIAAQAANTVIGNGTGSSAVPTALPMPSCSLTANALQWTAGTGFGCISHVNSVGLSMPSIFTVTNSPVTTSGTLTAALNTQNQNLVFAGPTTGAATIPTFRSLVGADLPNPSATTLGGVQSAAAVSNQWINSISTSGVPSLSQPAFSNISGTVAASQLPNPSASTLGGIQSAAAVSNQWINSISTSGVPALSQPGFSNLSGSLAITQHAAQAANTVIANGTGSSAVPTALAVPSCSTAASALNWTSGTGFACNTAVTAASMPISGLTGGPLSVALGGTNYTGGAFSTSAPTITCGTGTVTTASGTTRSLQIGKIVFFSTAVTITTNGTCAGNVTITLPATAIAAVQVLSGRDNGLTGKMLQGVISNTTMNIFFYDNAYPGGTGAVLDVSGSYEAA